MTKENVGIPTRVKFTNSRAENTWKWNKIKWNKKMKAQKKLFDRKQKKKFQQDKNGFSSEKFVKHRFMSMSQRNTDRKWM